MSGVFEKIIEPSLDRIPVLKVVHSEQHNGREYQLAQTVKRNVFTEFDRKLSHHLAATRGAGFPAFMVTVEVNDAQSKGRPLHMSSAYHNSVPHALRQIAERAFARVGPVELVLHRGDCDPGEVPSVGHRRQINSGDIEVLRGALGICSHLGETEFLDISGDFDVVIATPPGGLEPLVVNLKNGKVLVPSSQRAADPPFEWPIFAFAEHASTNLSAQGYLASVRHAIVIEKEAAILAFRSAAERRILDFDRALAGRVPEGHWLEGAKELVARLKAGLGDTLAGLSEDARGKALDWSTGIENAGNVRPVGVPRIVIGADKPKALRVAG